MKAKKWITWLCALATVAQVVLVGFSGLTLEAKAAETDLTPANKGETYYYDLADGAYFLTGTGNITVNGESKTSGSTLTVPGKYEIVKTFNGTLVTQYVVLFRQGDAHPDGSFDARDLVAMMKHDQGMEISEAGQMAVEAYTNKPDVQLMWDVLLENKTAEEAFPKGNDSVRYNDGTDSVMPIGGFLGPGYLSQPTHSRPANALVDYRTDEIFNLVKEAGINLIVATTNEIGSDAVEPVVQKELALAEKYGIGMFVQPSYATGVANNPEYFEQYIKELSAYSSFMGFTLQDEPLTNNYRPKNATVTEDKQWSHHKALAQMTNQYANLTGYTNLLPYWEEMAVNASTDADKEAAYRAYLEEYFTEYGNPKQLSFDYYVFSDKDTDRNATEYFTNLRIVREVAEKYGVPFWSVVQAGNYVSGNIIRDSKDTAYMTEGMTRWNVHTSLAYGAQGITYYPLLQPYHYGLQKNWIGTTKSTFNYDRNGIIGADGTTTPYYDMIKNVNTQILAVDEVLMNAGNMGLVVSEGSEAASDTAISKYAYGELTNLASANAQKGAMAGCFDYYGKNAFYVVNYDYNEAQDITLSFNGNYSLSVTVNGQTQIVNTENSAYTVSLRAGDAALVLVNGVPGAEDVDMTAVQTVTDILNSIPENAEMPKYYTGVMNAREAFDDLDKIGKMNISADLQDKLNTLVARASSYGVVYEAEGSQLDADYGTVKVWDLTGATSIADNLNAVPAQYSEVQFYVYNPTGSDVNATYGTVKVTLAAQSWTLVTVPADQVADNALTFASPVSGQWKVTRFYGVRDDAKLVANVQALIDALPEAADTTLAHEAQVVEARAKYDALDVDLRNQVDASKLTACENKIKDLKLEAEGKLIVIPNTAYGLVEGVAFDTNVYDATYESVMSFADATYFAIPENQITEAYKNSRSAVLYVYNPTEETAYLGVQLGDNGWIHRDRVTLYPEQWNRVELFDRGATHTSGSDSFVDNYITSGEAVYFYAVDASNAAATFAGEGWMVSGVYGMHTYTKDNLKDFEVVYDVETNWGLGGTGTEGEVIKDDKDFGTVYAFASATGFQLAGDKKTAAFRSCNDVVFYLYNPTDTEVKGFITSNQYWSYKSYVNLKPNAWNRIVISNFGGTADAQFVSDTYAIWFDMTLPAAADGAKWKMTNFYGIPNLKDDGTAATVEALINALPEANAVAMKDFAAIDQAKKAYDALGVQQNFVSATAKTKLDACVTAMDGYTVVFNPLLNAMLKAPDAQFTGTITTADDPDYGKVFTMDVTAAASGDYTAGFRMEYAFAPYDNLFFYIYNPFESNQNLWLYADNWEGVGTASLTPGWNRVFIDETTNTVDGAFFAMLPSGNSGKVGAWKISGVYSVTAEQLVKEEASKVEAMIHALPDASVLTIESKDAVVAARTAFDALSEEAKALVSQTAKDKLTACETKIAQLEQESADAAAIAQVEALLTGAPTAIGGDLDRIQVLHLMKAVDAKIGTLTEAQQATAKALQNYTALKALYDTVVADGYSLINGTDSVDNVDNVGAEVGNNGPKAIAPVNSWGNVLAFNYNVADMTGSYKLKAPAGYAGYTTVSFAVYNPTANAVAFVVYDNSWSNEKVVTVEGNSWGIITVDAVYANGFFVVINTTSASQYTWYVTGMMGYIQAQPPVDNVTVVNDAIAALPEANVMLVGDVEAVRAAETAYNNLSDEEKAKVVNVAKLNACIAKANFWDVLAAKNVLDAATVGLTTDMNGWGTSCTAGVDDNTFGKVMTVPAGATIIAIEPNKQGEAWKACTTIGFYIYNPTDSDVNGTYNMDVAGSGAFMLRAKSWNYIEIGDFAAASDQFISAGSTLYFHAAFTGEGWKISSFYNESAINVENATVIIDAATTGLSTDLNGWNNPCAAGVDDATFGKVMTVPAGATTLAIEPSRQNDVWKASKNLIFYIYNPTSSDVAGYLSNENWKYSPKFLLKANAWTRIEIADWGTSDTGKDYISADKTMYINAAFAGEGWKISSIYALKDVNPATEDPEAEAIAAVIAQITALPEADALTLANKDAVVAAQTAYNNLSEEAQAQVENAQKLTDCVARIAALEAIKAVEDKITALPDSTAMKVTDKEAVRAAETAYNALPEADRALVSNASKLTLCISKANFWDKLAGKIVVDASYQVFGVGHNNPTTLTTEALLTAGVDDNTFGKVISFSNSDYLAVTNDTKKKIQAFKQSNSIGFYIYNPTDAIVDGNYTMDWGYYGYFRLHPNSWNYIEIADFGAAANKQMITSDSTVYFYATFAGEGWKVSSFYSQDKGYEDVKDATVVIDAATQILGLDDKDTSAKITAGVDDETFGKVMTVSDATVLAVTPNLMNGNPAYTQSKNIVFYIYNPTNTDIDGNYTIDWGYYGYFQLKANSWNRIEIADFGAAANKQMISNGGTVYFYAAMTGEGWKISSFYGLTDPVTASGAAPSTAALDATARVNTPSKYAICMN